MTDEYLEKRKPSGYCPTCHTLNWSEFPICFETKKRYIGGRLRYEYYRKIKQKYCCDKCGTKWTEIQIST